MSYKKQDRHSNSRERIIEYLERALVLLDPPSNHSDPSSTKLTIPKVSQAYDTLLDAALLIDNFSGFSWNIELVELFSDVYKSLLVSCHLLLAMFEEHGDVNNTLSFDNMSTIQKTKQRCVILLQALGFKCRSEGNDLPSTQNSFLQCCFEGPEPLISLSTEDLEILSEEMEGESQTEMEDQVKECIDNYNDHIHECNNSDEITLEKDCTNLEGNQIDAEMFWNDHDNTKFNSQEYINPFQMDENQLKEEEDFLLQIAFSDSNPYSETNDTLRKGSCIEKNRSIDNVGSSVENNNSSPEIEACYNEEKDMYSILQEGWLEEKFSIQKETQKSSIDEKDMFFETNQGKEGTEITSCRYFCRLYKGGLLSMSSTPVTQNIQTELEDMTQPNTTTINREQEKIMPKELFKLYFLHDKSICEPIIHGKYFHFRLDNVHNLASCYADFTKDEIENLQFQESNYNVNLVLSIDKESQGDLINGFQWVTKLQSTIKFSLLYKKSQEHIQKSWEQDEWDRVCTSNIAESLRCLFEQYSIDHQANHSHQRQEENGVFIENKETQSSYTQSRSMIQVDIDKLMKKMMTSLRIFEP